MNFIIFIIVILFFIGLLKEVYVHYSEDFVKLLKNLLKKFNK